MAVREPTRRYHSTQVALLNNNKNSEYCAPLTSFDWNESEPSLVGTSSIDTTCTIWDLSVPAVKTQLIAHDKEVYDIAFARGNDLCGTQSSASGAPDVSVERRGTGIATPSSRRRDDGVKVDATP